MIERGLLVRYQVPGQSGVDRPVDAVRVDSKSPAEEALLDHVLLRVVREKAPPT